MQRYRTVSILVRNAWAQTSAWKRGGVLSCVPVMVPSMLFGTCDKGELTTRRMWEEERARFGHLQNNQGILYRTHEDKFEILVAFFMSLQHSMFSQYFINFAK